MMFIIYCIIESFEDKYPQNEEYKDTFDKEYVDFMILFIKIINMKMNY